MPPGSTKSKRRRNTDTNMSQIIRDFDAANPGLKPKEAAAQLKAQYPNIRPNYISTTRSQDKSRAALLGTASHHRFPPAAKTPHTPGTPIHIASETKSDSAVPAPVRHAIDDALVAMFAANALLQACTGDIDLATRCLVAAKKFRS